MTTSLDKKMLNGFTREVHDSLQQIRKSIRNTEQMPQGEVLEEALQCTHHQGCRYSRALGLELYDFLHGRDLR